MLKYPVAKKVPAKKTMHNREWVDDYSWLEDISSKPEVRQLIDSENHYFEESYPTTDSLYTELLKELKEKIKEHDQDVPEKIDNYYYYSKTLPGQEYEIHCRKKESLESPEEIYFDENFYAEGKEYYELGALEINATHNTAVVCTDYSGDEIYTAELFDLSSQSFTDLNLTNLSSDIEWTNDNKAFYYIELDKTQRPYKVFRYSIEAKKSELVWQEDNPEYFVGLSATKDERYILIESHGSINSEIYVLSASDSTSTPQLFLARKPKHEYYIGHYKEQWIVLSNLNNENFCLYTTKIKDSASTENWQLLYSGTEQKYLSDFEVFDKRLVIYERENAQDRIIFYNWETKQLRSLEVTEDCYQLESGNNSNFKTDTFEYLYSSMTKSPRYISHDFESSHESILKVYEVPNHYKESDYQSKRVFVEARDGAKIPISLLWNKKHPPEKAKAAYLYTYGAYGFSLDCGFDRKILSLVDRGVVFINLHVRGGADLGRAWYENGKFLNKKNTFFDIIDAAEYVSNTYSNLKQKLCLSGGSAGGLSVGASINIKPELFNMAILNVPFVDVINTMLDEDQALTALEYDEWGNPNDKEYFDYMYSYSPYDNIKEQTYPMCLAIAGLNDQRVKYHEALKWVQKVRSHCSKPEEIFLYTNTSSGHSGSTGRYEYLKEIAMEYAFILKNIGEDNEQ